MRASSGRLVAMLAALACVVLTACGTEDGPAPLPSGSPTAVPSRPAPTGPTGPSRPRPSVPAAEGGDLLVLPQQLNGFAIAGQQVVFLVAPGASDLPMTVTADATGAATTVLEATLSEPDDVAEVVVVPELGAVGVTVTMTGTGREDTEEQVVAFDVVEGEDDRAADAARMRDLFVPWLAANRPELGITEATEWQGTMVSPQWLVVSHYLFFSAEWEMHVEWHIMVAPDDWARIDLRRRFEETAPSEAFEVSSVTEGGEPHRYEVPASIWR